MNSASSNWRQLAAENRIVLLLALVFAVMSVIAPHFLTLHNQTTIMNGMSLNVLPVIGLTLVMVCRHIDLSIGTSLTLGGMLTIGLQPALGWQRRHGRRHAGRLRPWAPSTACSSARLKIDSFIVTLGAMIVTQGLVYIYGQRRCADRRRTSSSANWLETPVLPCSPRGSSSPSPSGIAAALPAHAHPRRSRLLPGRRQPRGRPQCRPAGAALPGRRAFALSGMPLRPRRGPVQRQHLLGHAHHGQQLAHGGHHGGRSSAAPP